MSTFNSWPVVAMPATPAPKSIEPSFIYIGGQSTNPFTGQQQVYDWQASYMELTVTMPPMDATDAAAWVDFFISCHGIANVFQLANTTFAGLIPTSADVNGYWRLTTNTSKWSVNDGVIYGFEFAIREAI